MRSPTGSAHRAELVSERREVPFCRQVGRRPPVVHRRLWVCAPRTEQRDELLAAAGGRDMERRDSRSARRAHVGAACDQEFHQRRVPRPSERRMQRAVRLPPRGNGLHSRAALQEPARGVHMTVEAGQMERAPSVAATSINRGRRPVIGDRHGLEVTDGGKKTTYYLKGEASDKFHKEICGATKSVEVTGAVSDKDGKKWLTVSSIKAK